MNVVISLLVISCILANPMNPAAMQNAFAPEVQIGWLSDPVISWSVQNTPDTPFLLYWSGNGAWLAQNQTFMTFEVQQLGNDVFGRLTLGNKSWTANDTEIAKDLTLGVWGIVPWLPGLIVEVGDEWMAELNRTAYASANRTLGNYVNGTMTSSLDSLQIGSATYDCIVFDYVQDEPGFGEAQRTTLAYDLRTGILVSAQTSYSFGIPYVLTLRLESVTYTGTYILVGVVAAVLLVIAVVMVIIYRSRRSSA